MRASGPATNDAKGQPRRPYVKEILRVGHYEHPTAGWEADITAESLESFVEAFAAMKANGVDVEVTVDHSGSARDVIGYITAMWVEGDSLMATHELIGEEAFALAETVHNTSVEIVHELVDGKGNAYGEAIVANSIVQAPVMPGQASAPFRIAASLRAARAHAVKHSIPLLEPETPPMDELLSLIQSITGAKDVTAENAASVLRNWADRVKAEKAEAQPDASEASRLDPEVIEDRAEASIERIDGLVTAGKIAPEAAKALSAALIGEPGKRNAIALSRSKDGRPSIARAVIEALGKNDPKIMAEAAAALGKLSLARGAPQAGGEADKPLTSEQRAALRGF